MEASSKERLLMAGMGLLLEQGYNGVGIQQVLAATSLPKGSFYHHFKSKEEFVLAVIDLYMSKAHEGLDGALGDPDVPPLQRVRNFFEGTTEKYREEGYLGCLIGGLGQELSGVSDTFRQKIEWCFSELARRIGGCLEEAVRRGDLPPGTDAKLLSNLLVNCWEGAALRSRLTRDPSPLGTMLDFYFKAARSS